MKKEKITAILLTVQEKDKFAMSNNKDGNYKKLKPEDSFKKLSQFFCCHTNYSFLSDCKNPVI